MKVVGISLLAMIFKIILLVLDVVAFNADEAIVALMARHTLNGEWQTFFYGQAYMGSLDTTLVAAGFYLFGQKVFVIRIVQIIIYGFLILTTAYLGRMIFKSERIGLLAALFLAIPSVNTTLYTTISLGGYGEALLIGNLLMIASLKATPDRSFRWYAIWGLLSGLGFWAFGMTLVFILPTAILLGYKLAQSGGVQSILGAVTGVISIIIGAAPLLIWGFENGFGMMLSEFLGSAISGASDINFFLSIYEHTINLFLFGSTVLFGLRPPWGISWLAVPLIPFALAFWLLVIGITIRSLRVWDGASVGRWLLVGVTLTLMMGFVLTPFGADPSGRYFLPILVPLAIFAGEFVENLIIRGIARVWISLTVSGVLLFNFLGTVQSAARTPPGLTTQFDSVTWLDHSYDEALIEFLERKGEVRGYTNYWVAYPLAFLSEERIIFIPKLPYHQDFRYTNRDNRYHPYDLEVAKSDQVAYITTNHPDLDQRLASIFRDEDISWEEAWIGDYHVFYDLSMKITPEELGIDRWAQENLEPNSQ
jgi:4-amino-4-deoxy-L-arabinose transferase-like glycosyltransferase